jgi:hypothetical protein
VICLADGDPAAALGALRDVLDGTAPVIGKLSPGELRVLRYLPANCGSSQPCAR